MAIALGVRPKCWQRDGNFFVPYDCLIDSALPNNSELFGAANKSVDAPMANSVASVIGNGLRVSKRSANCSITI